ncbi:MAG TPA: VCBS repeat-containing protein, partial [Puia sp.]|nr:VCBS repeat-containing protein [Puia sp.]
MAGWILLLGGCRHSSVSKPVLFKVLEEKTTGLDFSNTLSPTQDFNVFKYMYFYNGGGVGAGDFNNDGKIDIFFTGNQVPNKLYLNQGDLHFKDVTAEAR